MQNTQCQNCERFVTLSNYCLKHKRVVDDISSCSYFIADGLVKEQQLFVGKMEKRKLVKKHDKDVE